MVKERDRAMKSEEEHVRALLLTGVDRHIPLLVKWLISLQHWEGFGGDIRPIEYHILLVLPLGHAGRLEEGLGV